MHFDASGILHAWDEYPIKNFPSFWAWVESQVRSGSCRISAVALEEVGHKYPECETWLKERKIEKVGLTDEVLKLAEEIKELLGIEEEDYAGGAVDENDLLIIAAAKLELDVLLTNEARQNNLPKIRKKYKIPAVCEMHKVSVSHQNVREWIQASGEVFG